jgi:hypothetical protein
LAYAPIGVPGRKSGHYERLREYAAAIGADVGTLRNYRAVAHSWEGVDPGELGYSVCHALTPVQDKARLVEMLATTKPETRTGRWTVVAAVEAAQRWGLWEPRTEGRRPSSDATVVLRTLRWTRTSLARIAVDELDDDARSDALVELTSLDEQITALREALSARSERGDREVAAA